MEVLQWILSNGLELVGYAGLILGGIVAILRIVPGDQGEAALEKLAQFLLGLKPKK